MVGYPQSPSHLHNLHFWRQRVLNHQNKPSTCHSGGECRCLVFSVTVERTLRTERVCGRDSTLMLPPQNRLEDAVKHRSTTQRPF